MIESDCSMPLSLIQTSLNGESVNTIAKEISRLIQQFTNYKLQLILRDNNAVTDWLARNCNFTDIDIRIINISCFNTCKLLMVDNLDGHDG